MIQAFSELVAFRDVLLVLVWRDLKARYRGSVLGFLWTFLNPLLLMAVYALVFSVYVRVEIRAYPIFVFSGLLPWLWFSSAMLGGSNAIVESGSLIKRVPFPPQILPAVTVTASMVNFLLALPLLFALMWAWGFPLTPAIALLPFTIVVQYVLTLGLVISLSFVTVRYRDLHQILGNLLTLWFFLTPVLYPVSMVPPQAKPFLLVNPLAVLIVSYQNALYEGHAAAVWRLGAVAALAVLVFAGALALCSRLRWGLVEEL